MPNGDPDFDPKELDIFFAPIADVMVRFSVGHGLQLEKHYHESPAWSFLFRHPKKGIAKLDVQKVEEEKVRIDLAWWYDDYENATRSIKHSSTPLLDRVPKTVSKKLEECFTCILSWEFGDWTSIHKGYERIWHQMAKNDFEADTLRYPIPK